ncbi:hypothetical protein AKO1_006308 [Acrasis kona]|uniref:histidine kinase n=1 Tax=Acrasis kona TaxID=1008807 RepID=A0AAW2YH31_9EUKA
MEVHKKLKDPLVNMSIRDELNAIEMGIDSIVVCGEYQKTITNDVLLLSKLESNQFQLVLKPFQVMNLIEIVTQMFEASCKTKNISIKRELGHGIDELMILSDFTRVSQILINLLSNAVKFTHSGCITISVSHRYIHGGDSNRIELEFRVKDTGVGIHDKDKFIIFDRFMQATQRNMSEYQGSGLGLFISKTLTELMGGSIRVESRADVPGSTFSFTIQCQVCEPPPSSTNQVKKQVQNKNAQPVILLSTASIINSFKVPAAENQIRLSVLVVEDNNINMKVLVRMVQNCNCDCKSAKDGVEGLEMYNKYKFDLILMDVTMPRMCGYECTRRIRALERERGVVDPVVILGLSGNARFEHQEEGIASGMNTYMLKPIQQASILNAVEERRRELESKVQSEVRLVPDSGETSDM